MSLSVFGTVLVDTDNVYSDCTDHRFIVETTEKFYTELAHETIDNTVDEISARTTRSRRSPTEKTAALANLEPPHLTP